MNAELDYYETIPVQYDKGAAEFMGLQIKVDPRVLIPRPETAVLVKEVIDLCVNNKMICPKILEIGTGSGAIAVSLKKSLPDSFITATDISKDALSVAFKNLALFRFEDGITLTESDLFGSIHADEQFDLIVSNPPYVSSRDYLKCDSWVKAEPSIALCGGEEGLDVIMKIAGNASRYLTKSGFLAMEIGYDQADSVKNIFENNGFSDIAGIYDENGIERVIRGRKNG